VLGVVAFVVEREPSFAFWQDLLARIMSFQKAKSFWENQTAASIQQQGAPLNQPQQIPGPQQLPSRVPPPQSVPGPPPSPTQPTFPTPPQQSPGTDDSNQPPSYLRSHQASRHDDVDGEEDVRSTGGTVFYFSSDLSKPEEAVVDEAGKKGNLT